MLTTGTGTVTYTASDISKVVDMFAADYNMIAQASGLSTRDYISKVISDIKAMARAEYLSRVTVCLLDAGKNPVQAAAYEVSTDASSWTPSRPGNNLWPRTPSGSLNVIVSYNKNWSKLTATSKATFEASLNLRWSDSDIDISFPRLNSSTDRKYASNAYGWDKRVYS